MIAYLVRPAIASFRYQVRVNLTTLSSVIIFIFTPIIFGAVAVLFFRAHDAEELATRAVLGSAIVAIWTTALMLSNITLGNERWSGVVELFLATPTRLGALMVGKLLANSAQGLIAAALALLVISTLSLSTISIDRPGLLAGSVVLSVVSIGTLAFAWSPILFISRNATSVFFLLDTFLVFVSAIFFPVSALPEWLQPVSHLSPLRWASEAMVTSSSETGAVRDTYEAWAALGALALVYGSVGVVGYSLLERRLRRTGVLSTF